MTEAEFLKVREALRFDKHKLLLSLAWYTAERWGALLQLRTEDIYEGKAKPGKPRTVIVIPKLSRKDRKTREVKVTRNLTKALIDFQPAKHGWVCPSTNPDKPQSMNTAGRVLKWAASRAGLEELNISTHSTRRGAITALAKAGYQTRLIQKFTGHSSLASLERYMDFSEDDVLSMASSL